MNEEKWKKSREIKLGYRAILEQRVFSQLKLALQWSKNITWGYILWKPPVHFIVTPMPTWQTAKNYLVCMVLLAVFFSGHLADEVPKLPIYTKTQELSLFTKPQASRECFQNSSPYMLFNMEFWKRSNILGWLFSKFFKINIYWIFSEILLF